MQINHALVCTDVAVHEEGYVLNAFGVGNVRFIRDFPGELKNVCLAIYVQFDQEDANKYKTVKAVLLDPQGVPFANAFSNDCLVSSSDSSTFMVGSWQIFKIPSLPVRIEGKYSFKISFGAEVIHTTEFHILRLKDENTSN